jgi:hypothetical protein
MELQISERVAELPSSKRRGGRDIKKDAAKPPLTERTGWSSMTKHFGMPTTFYVSRYRAHASRPSAAIAKRKRGSAQHKLRWASPLFS